MTPEALLAYCLAKPGAWPDFPWGEGPDGHEHPVVKVGPSREVADEWLARYPGDAR